MYKVGNSYGPNIAYTLNIRLFFITRQPDSLNKTAVAQMVWFEQPSTGDPLTQTWKEHILFSGPDAVFRLEHMTVDGRIYDVIISTQYFAEQLVISWIEGLYNLCCYDCPVVLW